MDSLNSEYERLRTFRNLSVQFITVALMASAGFYYLEEADRVRCAFCNVEVGCWVEGDDSIEDHQRWSPSYNFIKNRSVNILLNSSTDPPFAFEQYGIELRLFTDPYFAYEKYGNELRSLIVAESNKIV